MSPIHYSDHGHGAPLVLLHGFCETHEIWDEFIQPLTTHFRVLCPDLPGFGKSPPLPEPFTLDQVGDELANWLRDQKVQPAMIIGHSLGGYVTLSMASRHSSLVQGFGLFHSTAFADSEEKKESRNKIIEFVSNHGVLPFVDTFVPGLFYNKSDAAIPRVHRIAAQTSQRTLVGYSKAMRDRQDRSVLLSKGEIPKLLIAGMEDMAVPLGMSREMAKISQNCSFFELKKVAHMGFFEAKSECQEIIARITDAVFFNN